MCGIAGIFSTGAPISVTALQDALTKLHHRGPDHQGVWSASHKRVGLGNARLRIMDLSTGDQPIANEDGSIHAVVNGELYDFERIRDELEAKGHRFATRSDSEIVIHLYEEYGRECLHHLRGEFALILWDERNQTLFAARDRFGIKPLFYAHVGETLYLASEIKALFAAGVPVAWDETSFYQQLFMYPDLDRTLFAGVRQVPPGHFLTAADGGHRVAPYWDLDYPLLADAKENGDDNELIERFRDKLTESVRVRMRSDVPVSSFLSGGIDSSVLAALARPMTPRGLEAFTVSFSEADYDESHIAADTAAMIDARFTRIPLSPDDLADALPDAVAHCEIPGINMHGVARFLQCRDIRNAGYKVSLTGEGADEILGGYSSFHHDQYLSTHGAADFPHLQGVQRRLGFVPRWLSKLSEGRSIFHALLAPDFEARHGRRQVYDRFLDCYDVRGQLEGRAPMLQSMYLWARSVLPNYILLTDRLEMAFSVETRLPYLDHQLFELVRNFPTRMLLRETTSKYVLREAGRELISDEVYRRPKHPFSAPQTTLREDGRLFEMLHDTLRGSMLKRLPFFDGHAVVGLLDALPGMSQSQKLALDPALMMIMSACFLQDRYNP